MNHEEEMIYRDKILSKARNGEKLTPEDRLWLVTHRIINRKLGYPYLNSDIINLSSNRTYSICVKIEKCNYLGRIIPIVTVPGGKGEIITDFVLTAYDGKKTKNKAVKMLGLTLNSDHTASTFFYKSDIGLLGISYECDYFDDKLNIATRQNSSTGSTDFAMIKEVLSNNKIQYKCKIPTSDSFDSFVFSVEWT